MTVEDLRNAQFDPTVWQDEVLDNNTPPNVLQVGTPVNQTNLNAIETALLVALWDIGSGLLFALSMVNMMSLELQKWQNQRLIQGQGTIVNSSPGADIVSAYAFVNIAFPTGAYPEINSPNYDVLVTPISADDLDRVGQLRVSNKTQNGFTVTMTGSAGTCTFLWTVVNPSVK